MLTLQAPGLITSNLRPLSAAIGCIAAHNSVDRWRAVWEKTGADATSRAKAGWTYFRDFLMYGSMASFYRFHKHSPNQPAESILYAFLLFLAGVIDRSLDVPPDF